MKDKKNADKSEKVANKINNVSTKNNKSDSTNKNADNQNSLLNLKRENVNKNLDSKQLNQEKISNSTKIEKELSNIKHIFVNVKDKFLFLYTFICKYNDKRILIVFSTQEEQEVRLN